MPAKSTPAATTKPTDTTKVDEYMSALSHPMKEMAEELRKVILDADKAVGEEIAWNAPSFFYTGKMEPFKPKEYKRIILVFNFFKKDCIRLIFLRGASVDDGSGMLEGTYADGRRLMLFHAGEDINKKKNALAKLVKEVVKIIKVS